MMREEIATGPGGELHHDVRSRTRLDRSERHEAASWRRPIRTWFRRTGDGWTLVRLERMPMEVNQTGQENTR
jgi:hypothetical protein